MYFSTQELEARGWTKGLIKRFFPEPHLVRRNPLFGVTHFYRINSVAISVDTEEFRLLQGKLLRRRKTAIESAEKAWDAFSAVFVSLVGNI